MPKQRSSDHPAGEPAAMLYAGKVMHARLRPVSHRFNYRVISILIDLDRLDEADRQSRLFAVNRRGLFSFHEVDHGKRSGRSLREHVADLAADRGVSLAGGRVWLLCYPRLFGYAFNPLSIYFCHDASGRLALVIYEVRNTFGDIHSYVIPVESDHRAGAWLRQSQSKEFYVSPFLTMNARYNFRLQRSDEHVKTRILQTDASGPLLSATFSGRRRPLSSRSLLAVLFTLPVFTFKVIAAIHWEALRLWLKGAQLVPRPHQPVSDNRT